MAANTVGGALIVGTSRYSSARVSYRYLPDGRLGRPRERNARWESPWVEQIMTLPLKRGVPIGEVCEAAHAL